MKIKNKILFLLIPVLIIKYCEKPVQEIPTSPVLAKIGDKIITVDEFKRRAEFTIRPPYCNRSNSVHKDIVLNSLIAEKMFALETNADSVIQPDSDMEKYLRGRKEQAMRQYHYYNEAYNKVKVDTADIKKAFQLAANTYNVSFVRLPNINAGEEARRILRENSDNFDEVIKELFDDGKIPTREINYLDPDKSKLYEAFFNQPVGKDQILGPIELEDGSSMLLKVNDWITRPVITNHEIQQRYHDVREKLHAIEAQKKYAEIVGGLMAGKRMDFIPETFSKVCDFYKTIYIESKKQQKDQLNQQLWEKDYTSLIDDSLITNLADIADEPLFTLEGQTFTVAGFRELLKSHPLVFRTKKISPDQFPYHLRNAIADLMRDQYINRDAYEKGYDQMADVRQYVSMWKDNTLSIYHKYQVIKNSTFDGDYNADYLKAIEQYLQPYTDSLQSKYSDRIFINLEEYDKITLSRIDMYALQENAAYPIVVPSFPLITMDSRLNYGNKMAEK